MTPTIGEEYVGMKANSEQSLSKEEYEELMSNFSTFVDDGVIEVHNLLRAYKTSSTPKVAYEDIMNAVKTVKKSSNVSELTKDEFLQVAAMIKPKSTPARGSGFTSKHKITKITGSADAYQHSIDEEEKVEFTNHINVILSADSDVSHKLPIPVGQGNELFVACSDGLILCKLINHAVQDTIDERVLNKGTKLSTFHMTENNNVAINSAKAIGCSTVNIGSEDIIHGRQHLILGLIWQIIKMGLFSKITLRSHPELYRLLEPNETIDELLRLSPDMILLRWFNYHLKQAKHNRKVSNFSSDIQDSECYTVLLHQLCPKKCSLDPLRIPNLVDRAEALLKNADSIDCRRYVTATSICSGNPKLNLAFVANLFNTHPGLAPLEPQEQANIDEKMFGSEGDREARAFALWLNSLNVDPFVYNIFFDLRDGRILLQAIDKIHPNLVQFTKVNMTAPLSRFKSIENTNYIVHVGKDVLKFSLVGTQGADLTDGNRVLTLGMVWQLMRYHIMRTLKSITLDGKEPTDADLIKWANESVSKCPFYSTPIQSFRDSQLADGIYLLALLSCLRKGCVDTGLIAHEGDKAQDKGASVLTKVQASQLNAKYAIGVARKIGATIFLLPEDIVEVKPKMILTFVGSLMALASKP